jgi:hypothetical protein
MGQDIEEPHNPVASQREGETHVLSAKAPLPKEAVVELVKIYYDVQDVRIASENRLRTVGVVEGVNVSHLKKLEKEIRNRIHENYKDDPLYKWLRSIRGIGPVLAGGLISGIDIRKAEHVSSLWKYFGYHVVNGEAVKKRRGEKLGFNPDMRTLGYKIADSFVKHRTPVYRQIYEERKKKAMEKLHHPEINPENCPKYEKCMEELKRKATRLGRGVKAPPCAKHIHLRACRETVKEFLRHLWVKWRMMEGLPVSKPYAVQILGHSDKNSHDMIETQKDEASQKRKGTRGS